MVTDAAHRMQSVICLLTIGRDGMVPTLRYMNSSIVIDKWVSANVPRYLFVARVLVELWEQ